MQQALLLLLIPLALAAGAALAFWAIKKNRRATEDALGKFKDDFLALASEKFGHEQTKGQATFTQSVQQMENSQKQVSATVETLTRLVKEFENDRSEKYGSLQTRLESATQVTSRLQQTTDRLTSMLANVKLRGQWGERVAEDILRMSGFVEGTHYRKNRTQETVITRPDFVFLLPNDWKVYMDVKFPLDNYMALMNSENPEKRESFQTEFIRDVKDRIKEITKRDYINPTEQTLDCVILFIPNEQVYGFIHETAPGLMDEAMHQRVILCSPFTLYAVLAIIRQSFEDFHFKKAASEILNRIQSFQDDFENFKKRFEDLGSLLEKTANKYREITDKSYKRLDTQIRKIDEYRKGNALLTPAEKPAPDSPALLPSSES